MARRPLVVVPTLAALLLGVVVGYRNAGVGGAILYGAVIGLGGAIFGSLMDQTVTLLQRSTVLRRSWKVAVATTALIVLAILTWNVYL